MAARTEEQNGEGLSFETLLIAAISSAIAAVVVSQFWQGGTPIAAAVTPVIVSLVGEAIRRPMRSELVRRPARRAAELGSTPVRRYRTGEQPVPTPPVRERRAGEGRTEPLPPGEAGDPDRRERATEPLMDAAGGANGDTAYNVYRSGGGERPGWRERLSRNRVKVALVTGVLAFLVAALALTLPELIFGGSVTGTDRNTTFFGGDGKDDDRDRDRDDERDRGGDEEQDRDSGGGDSQAPDRPSGAAPEQGEGDEPSGDEPPSGEEPPQDSPPDTELPQPPPAPTPP